MYKYVKWKNGNEVDKKPPFDVILSNFLKISFRNIRFRIFKLAKETENNIEIKIILDNLVPNNMNLVGRFCKSNIEHRSNA